MAKEPKKLSEVAANRISPLATHHSSFASAYPTVEKLDVVVFQREGLSGWKRLSSIDQRDYTDIVDCTNGLCTGGGVRINRILWRMVPEKKTEEDVVVPCEGRERYRTCQEDFRVTIKIVYRPEVEASASIP